MRKPFLLILSLLLCVTLFACRSEEPTETPNTEPPASAGDTAPELLPEQLKDVDFESAAIHTAEAGEIRIIPETVTAAAPKIAGNISPDEIWTDKVYDYVGDFTMPDAVQMENGSIGLLVIPKIGLAVNAFESDDEMEAMTKGIAHFKTTSCYNGNVGFAAHNVNLNGTDGFFKNIHTLKAGDKITLQTSQGTRRYTVETSKSIDENDWTMLGRTNDNRVTLITCISGQPARRYCVQAVEVAE